MASAWAAAFRPSREEPRPSGFFTRKELAAMVGVCRETFSRRMAAMLDKGLVEKRMWRDQRGQPVPVYRLKSLDKG